MRLPQMLITSIFGKKKPQKKLARRPGKRSVKNQQPKLARVKSNKLTTRLGDRGNLRSTKYSQVAGYKLDLTHSSAVDTGFAGESAKKCNISAVFTGE